MLSEDVRRGGGAEEGRLVALAFQAMQAQDPERMGRKPMPRFFTHTLTLP